MVSAVTALPTRGSAKPAPSRISRAALMMPAAFVRKRPARAAAARRRGAHENARIPSRTRETILQRIQGFRSEYPDARDREAQTTSQHDGRHRFQSLRDESLRREGL